MNMLIIIALASFIFSGCSKLNGPVQSQDAKVTSQSNHVVSVISYEIPKGIFRGVLWPNSTTQYFEVWIIDGSKEKFFKISAPPELIVDFEDITKSWTVKKVGIDKNRVVYAAVNSDISQSLKIELPVKKRDYRFTILNNASGDVVILFMDIDENIVDSGIFGYVLMKKQS